MPDLPHGWRLRNRDGEIAGPPLEEDGAYFSGDDSADDENRSVGINGLDIKPDSEGWDDVEDDTEEVSIKCLLCEENFTGAKIMIEHCKNAHDFDFIQVQAKHNLDFYSSIKLINYIRSEVLAGNRKPDVEDASSWADDKYLQPALEDDALLFTLDDIDERPVPEADDKEQSVPQSTASEK